MTIKQIPAAVVWPIRHTVMYPSHDFESIKLRGDDSAIHFGLYDEELLSVVSVFTEGNALQFRKFATVEKYQGKGYGSLLLDHIIKYAKEHGFTRIWCNARVNASGFYEKFGFTQTKERYHKDGFDFVIMERGL